ncbi:MAG TPA: T9SS type A sorting domain-containing protein [Candidatus Saccharimonadales bacterium]|nr:T9SS type A sorting domain-containing protein [Candidatus Saccharimonadales bacterium]
MRLTTALCACVLVAAGLLLAAPHAMAQVQINEIRTDNTGTDTDEYFELKGPPGMSLTNYWYIVIGDTTVGRYCGTIESVTPLAGFSIQADGLLCLRNSNDTPVLTGYDGAVKLNFENSDNVTHMLVTGFTGTRGQDLDTNDDGVLDITPWTGVVDAVGLTTGLPVNCSGGSEYIYCSTVLGPDGGSVPGHVYRCADTNAWVIGKFSPLGLTDTPGAPNYTCAAPPPIFVTQGRTPCVPDLNEAATATATVLNANVANLYWKVNGGAETRVTMSVTRSSGDTTVFSGVIPGQPNDGDKVEYYVKAYNDTPDSTTAYGEGYFVGTVTVGAIRVNDVNGMNVYRYYGARVRGHVTAAYGVFAPADTTTDFYVQDATGGLNLYHFHAHTVRPLLGDDLTAAGTIDQYNGKLELTSSGACDSLYLTVNGSGLPPAPQALAVPVVTEAQEGVLLRATHATIAVGADVAFVANKTYKLYNGTDSTRLYIDGDTNIPGMPITDSTVAAIEGIGQQYDNTSPYTAYYEFVPRSRNDIALGATGVGGTVTFVARLGPSVPNPAGRQVRISYVIPGTSGGAQVPVSLRLYDVQGRLVRTVVEGAQEPGAHSAALDCQAAGLRSNGIYFYRLQVGGQTFTRKMVLVH